MTNVILNECERFSQLFRHPEEWDEGSSEVYDMKKALLKQGLRMEKVFPSSVRAERSLSEP